MRKKILIAAGGSGGHLFPAQDLASGLQNNADLMIAGHNVGKSPFFKGSIPHQDIPACAPKRSQFFRFLGKTGIGFWKSVQLMIRFSPDLVVGFGSYHTFPVLLAAWVLRKKIVLFEANCILGKVNRLFARSSYKIATQFPLLKPLPNSVLVSLLPWSKKSQDRVYTREEAFSYFGLDPEVKTFLIFGGSQGAQFLNEMMPKAIDFLSLDFPFQVIHFTGKGTASYLNVASCVKEFEPRMDLAYLAADIVICRSGAGTVAELIRFCKPSLLIPFPFATENHQWENGRLLADVIQGARLLKQEDASIEAIRDEIVSLAQETLERKEALSRWKSQGKESLSEWILKEAIHE